MRWLNSDTVNVIIQGQGFLNPFDREECIDYTWDLSPIISTAIGENIR